MGARMDSWKNTVIALAEPEIMERTVNFTVLQIAIPRVKISTNHVKIVKKVGVVIVQK